MKSWLNRLDAWPSASWTTLLAATAAAIPRYRSYGLVAALVAASLLALTTKPRRPGLLWLSAGLVLIAALTLPLPLPPAARHPLMKLALHLTLWSGILSLCLAIAPPLEKDRELIPEPPKPPDHPRTDPRPQIAEPRPR